MHVGHKKSPLVLDAVIEEVIQEDELEYVVFSSGIQNTPEYHSKRQIKD